MAGGARFLPVNPVNRDNGAAFPMKIDVVSDTVCPWCYIGKRRLERALSVMAAPAPEIAWHPFQLNPDMPAGGMDRKDYLAIKFGGAWRAERVYGMISRAAEAESMILDFAAVARTPNTVDSHRLIRHAGEAAGPEAQNAVVEALFRAYFEAGEDIGDRAALARVAGACGLDEDAARDWLDSGAGAGAVRDRDRRFREAGVRGAPLFIVDGRYAVSGAQDPEVFRQVLSAAAENRAAGGAPEADAARLAL